VDTNPFRRFPERGFEVAVNDLDQTLPFEERIQYRSDASRSILGSGGIV
jgi:hypothetical protein